MYEYTIRHIHCGMQEIICGYNQEDAFRRSKFNPKLWEVIDREYID